ncbi:TPM domain-containing protein [Sphingobacterium sp. LRF_L2]|uniref:TPM domain-containing protein n=1 Tax=Sphingobacterium sp. LRF_L2 TaxID=3369421 RepID=UPI003F6372B6
MVYLIALKRSILFPVFFFLCFAPTLCSFAQYSISNLPSPKQKGQDYFVSNPDAILSAGTEHELNQLAVELEKAVGVEYAIVAVNDFEGYDLFEFALELFNTWGVGKKGQDNGLLLLIAKDRREYRFISGYRVEGLLPDVYLRRIGDKFLVPNFRAGDYDQGVLEASQAIKQALLSPDAQAELDRLMPESIPFFSLRNTHLQNSLLVILLYIVLYYWVSRVGGKTLDTGKKNKRKSSGWRGWGIYTLLGFLATVFSALILFWICAFAFDDPDALFSVSAVPYVLGIWGSYVLMFKIYEVRDAIVAPYSDEENKLQALRRFQLQTLIPYIFSPFMFIGFLFFLRRWKNSRPRFTPPDTSGNWDRVNRDDTKQAVLNKLLSEGQRKEESLATKFYEIWINKQTSERRILGWEGKRSHSVCPACGFKTYKLRASKTLKVATYTTTGIRKRYNQCAFCKHEEDLGNEVIPVKSRSSSSGGSGGSSSSGGGSSSSSSGSFGGGSSGGGGAGGRW